MNPPKPLTEMVVSRELSANYGLIAMDISKDGKHIAVGDYNSRISIWNVETFALERSLTGMGLNTEDVAFSPDAKYLAIGER